MNRFCSSKLICSKCGYRFIPYSCDVCDDIPYDCVDCHDCVQRKSYKKQTGSGKQQLADNQYHGGRFYSAEW